MVIPLDIDDCKPYQCHKLLKSLYDLMQASQTWYEKLFVLLLSYGYNQAHANHSLFVKNEGKLSCPNNNN